MKNYILWGSKRMDDTLEILSNDMYRYPIGSETYNIRKQTIEEELRKSLEYRKYLICFPNKLNQKSQQNDLLKDLLDLPDFSLVEIQQQRMFDEDIRYPGVFSDKQTFLSDSRFVYIERYKAEYNSMFKHLIVSCYITDGDQIILLQSSNERIEGKYSLIGVMLNLIARVIYYRNSIYYETT
jgi:hypothetical protein